MTSQDIKKQLKEPHFWNIVLTGQHAEPRTKAMLEAKGIITWLPLAPVRRQWGRILKEIHTPVIPRCVFVYISNDIGVSQCSERLSIKAVKVVKIA